LPQLLFHHAPSWQDSARPRAGLCGARAGFVLEAYGLHSTLESRQEQAGFLGELVQRWFNHWQLPAAVMPGDGGPAAESAQDWFLRLPGGGDQTLACPACGYAASSQAAEFKRNKPENTEEPLPLQEVATPACPTIESLARFLGVSEARTAKAVFVMVRHGWKANAKEELIFAVVRGDRALNETRLLRLLGGSALRPASSEEIERIGACPGYASPVSLRGVRVVVDSEIPLLSNLVAGANKTGYHLLNVNYGRDYTAALVAPIAAAQAGDPCPTCGKALELVEGAVLAQQVQYSAEFSSGQDCAVIDESGKSRPVLLECLRLHTSRAVGCLAELHRDASGLCWPPGAAPFDVHVVALPGKTLDITPALTGLEHQLAAAGLDALVDDRSESPGVKFADADLLGIPIRLTLGERGLQQGMIEVKIRKSGEKSQVALAEAASMVNPMTR
jgi:prolyl-tRNA synthetase